MPDVEFYVQLDRAIRYWLLPKLLTWSCLLVFVLGCVIGWYWPV